MYTSLNQWDEDSLIQDLIFPLAQTSNQIPIPLGDDCAAVYPHGDRYTLYTSDNLIENVHFRRHQISPYDLGIKSLASNLSDIAAMGGVPLYALLGLCLPGSLDKKWIESFLLGFKSLAKKEKVALIGGNTSTSPESIVVYVTLVGSSKTPPKKRKGSLEGDFICLTGEVGNSYAGLCLLQEGEISTKKAPYLIKSHTQPKAHLEEGYFLGQQKDIHAMMDVSDGLIKDLQRFSESSYLGARVELSHLPLSNELKIFAQGKRICPYQFAARGGEDYVLLLSINPNAYPKISKSFLKRFKKPLFKIGHMDKQKGLHLYLKEKKIPTPLPSFEHF